MEEPTSEQVSVLYTLDTQNIYYSATSLHGRDARIDFRKLKETALENRNPSFVRSVAFVNSHKIGDNKFVNYLRKAGFDIIEFDDSAGEAIARYLTAEGGKFGKIIVSSGTGSLLDFYQSNPETAKKVTVLAYADSIHKDVPDLVKEVIALDSRVLMDPVNKEDNHGSERHSEISES